MKNKLTSLLLLNLFATVFLVASCSPAVDKKETTIPIPQSISEVPKVSIDELFQFIEKGSDIVIVDVRDKEEYIQAHIKGSISVPPPKIESEEWEPPSGKAVILY